MGVLEFIQLACIDDQRFPELSFDCDQDAMEVHAATLVAQTRPSRHRRA
jgi:hypothetical protein